MSGEEGGVSGFACISCQRSLASCLQLIKVERRVSLKREGSFPLGVAPELRDQEEAQYV